MLTYNGNEMMLQNDMGNTLIQDSATGNIMGLNPGFIPTGIKEHGGIMYITSVGKDANGNPIGEIGTIPSPIIRDIYKDKITYTVNNFIPIGIGDPLTITHKLYPADKFIVNLNMQVDTNDLVGTVHYKDSALSGNGGKPSGDPSDIVLSRKVVRWDGNSRSLINLYTPLISYSNPEVKNVKIPLIPNIPIEVPLFSTKGVYSLDMYSTNVNGSKKVSGPLTSPQWYNDNGINTESKYWYLHTDKDVFPKDLFEATLNKALKQFPSSNKPGQLAVKLTPEKIGEFGMLPRKNDPKNTPITVKWASPSIRYRSFFPGFYYSTDSGIYIDCLKKIKVIDESTGKEVSLHAPYSGTVENIHFNFRGTALSTRDPSDPNFSKDLKVWGDTYGVPHTQSEAKDQSNYFILSYAADINDHTKTDFVSSDVSMEESPHTGLFYANLGAKYNNWYRLELDYYDQYDNLQGSFSTRFNPYINDTFGTNLDITGVEMVDGIVMGQERTVTYSGIAQIEEGVDETIEFRFPDKEGWIGAPSTEPYYNLSNIKWDWEKAYENNITTNKKNTISNFDGFDEPKAFKPKEEKLSIKIKPNDDFIVPIINNYSYSLKDANFTYSITKIPIEQSLKNFGFSLNSHFRIIKTVLEGDISSYEAANLFGQTGKWIPGIGELTWVKQDREYNEYNEPIRQEVKLSRTKKSEEWFDQVGTIAFYQNTAPFQVSIKTPNSDKVELDYYTVTAEPLKHKYYKTPDVITCDLKLLPVDLKTPVYYSESGTANWKPWKPGQNNVKTMGMILLDVYNSNPSTGIPHSYLYTDSYVTIKTGAETEITGTGTLTPAYKITPCFLLTGTADATSSVYPRRFVSYKKESDQFKYIGMPYEYNLEKVSVPFNITKSDIEIEKSSYLKKLECYNQNGIGPVKFTLDAGIYTLNITGVPNNDLNKDATITVDGTKLEIHTTGTLHTTDKGTIPNEFGFYQPVVFILEQRKDVEISANDLNAFQDIGLYKINTVDINQLSAFIDMYTKAGGETICTYQKYMNSLVATIQGQEPEDTNEELLPSERYALIQKYGVFFKEAYVFTEGLYGEYTDTDDTGVEQTVYKIKDVEIDSSLTYKAAPYIPADTSILPVNLQGADELTYTWNIYVMPDSILDTDYQDKNADIPEFVFTNGVPEKVPTSTEPKRGNLRRLADQVLELNQMWGDKLKDHLGNNNAIGGILPPVSIK